MTATTTMIVLDKELHAAFGHTDRLFFFVEQKNSDIISFGLTKDFELKLEPLSRREGRTDKPLTWVPIVPGFKVGNDPFIGAIDFGYIAVGVLNRF